jgi:hypothetical protein
MLHHERLRAQAWLRAAESMYVPYGEKLKMTPQDDNSGQRALGLPKHAARPLSAPAPLPSATIRSTSTDSK